MKMLNILLISILINYLGYVCFLKILRVKMQRKETIEEKYKERKKVKEDRKHI